MSKVTREHRSTSKTGAAMGLLACVIATLFTFSSDALSQNLRFDELVPDGEDLSVYGDEIT